MKTLMKQNGVGVSADSVKIQRVFICSCSAVFISDEYTTSVVDEALLRGADNPLMFVDEEALQKSYYESCPTCGRVCELIDMNDDQAQV